MNKQIDLLNDLCMKPEVIVTKKGKIEVDITKGDLPAILFPMAVWEDMIREEPL